MAEAIRQPRDPRDLNGTVAVVAHVDAGYLSLAGAATYLGVSTRTVRRWCGERALPHYFVPGPGLGGSRPRKTDGPPKPRGTLLFRRRELDAWLRKRKNGLVKVAHKTLDAAVAEA